MGVQGQVAKSRNILGIVAMPVFIRQFSLHLEQMVP